MMSSTNKKLNSFRIIFSFLILIGGILIILLMISATINDNLFQAIMCVPGLFVFIFIISKMINVIEKIESGIENEKSIKPKGFIGEIWDAVDDLYKRKDIKVNHLDKTNNIIDMVLLKNGHEFAIVIDNESIGIIVDDEETDNPLEVELPVSEIKDINLFLEWLMGFIESNSTSINTTKK